jgi:hypothetical protein
VNRRDRILRFSFIPAFLFLALLMLAVSSAGADDLLKEGQKAPAFSTNAYDGKSFTLTDAYQASPVLLVFLRGFS